MYPSEKHPIEVVFSKARGRWMPLSRLICLFEHTPFSHVSVALHRDGKKSSWMFETTSSGCHLLLREDWEKKHIPVETFHYEQTDTEDMDLAIFINNQLGRPYGRLAFLSLFLKRLGIWTPPGWRKWYVCSSLVAAALDLPRANSLDPKALWEYLQSHKEVQC